jgi:large subunit ribosomal protein L21
MFAVIKTGGKQYRVTTDDVIAVERLEGEAGAKVELTDVLMVAEDGKAPMVGAPGVEGAVVEAEVVEQTRGEKIIVFKKKRRQNYRRKNGHRQDLTLLRVTGVSVAGRKLGAAAAKAAPKRKKTEAAPAPEAELQAAESKE